MGIIRLLLALAVVFGHASVQPIYKLIGGNEIPVQAFYLISGFYIAMIFQKNYSNSLNFWKSRYLRLFPIYLTCALSALYFRGYADFFNSLKQLSVGNSMFLIFTNLTMLFQDLTIFLRLDGDSFRFTGDLSSAGVPFYSFLLLPQAWSIGLEISFYILAPFLLISEKRILLALSFSILVRILLQYNGLSQDPWNYRFFPSELGVFLIGSLMYIWGGRFSTMKGSVLRNQLMLAFLVIYILIFPLVPVDFLIKKILFYVLLALHLPGIFALTRNSYIDNLLGALSYPIYCVHLVLLQDIVPRIQIWTGLTGFLYVLEVLVLVMVISYGLYQFVEKPFDRYRMRFKLSSTPRLNA